MRSPNNNGKIPPPIRDIIKIAEAFLVFRPKSLSDNPQIVPQSMEALNPIIEGIT